MADVIAIRIDEPIVNEGSAVVAQVAFRTRSTAAASTPSSIRYRVDCLTTKRAIVEWTSASAASTATITIPGTSNGIVSDGNNFEERQLTVEIDTDLDTQARASKTWKVRNIRTFDGLFEWPPGLPNLEPFFPITNAEISAGVTPTSYQYAPGHLYRYGTNTTPGTTDLSTALQAAVDQYAQGGAEVVLPDEPVLISQRIEITSANGLAMRGSGYQSVITCAAASTFIFFLFQRSDFGAVNGVRLRDFRIDANGSGQLDAGVIQLNGCVGFVVDGIWIEDASRASGSSGVNGISLSSGSHGVGENPRGVIQNCYLTGCSKSPINCSTGTDGVDVLNNICHSNTGNGSTPGIQIFGGINCTVRGNKCYNNEGPGIFIATSSAFNENPDYCIVENNHCYDNGQGSTDGEGISVQNGGSTVSGRILIRGNHCYRNGVNVSGGSAGILVQEHSNVIVDGNYCYSNYGSGVILDQGSNPVDNISIINNTLEENNRADAANGAGILVRAGTYTKLVIRGNKYFDNQGTPTQDWAVRFDTSGSVTDLAIDDDQARGHTNTVNYSLAAGMTFSRLRLKLEWTLATTDATNTNGPTITLADNTASFVLSTVVAMETDGSDRALYRVSALVYRDGAGATVQGAVAADQTIESDATWDSTIIVGGNNVAPRVTGAAATNINWRGTLQVLSVS